MSTIEELIKRCQGPKGALALPQLNGEVWCKLHGWELLSAGLTSGAGQLRVLGQGGEAATLDVAHDWPLLSTQAALELMPEGWWLTGLGEVRSPIIYRGDEHRPTGVWQASLQHVKGGRLQTGNGPTAASALCVALLRVSQREETR